jgi:flagellar basal body-associated protein FliL
MKRRDVVLLVLAMIIFVVAGYLAVANLLPKQTAKKTVKVEVVGSIPSELDSTSLTSLTDTTKSKDFTVPIDLSTGLGNQAVFGQ